MSFYVTLPSNASMQLFPNNVIGSFTTKLFNPIDLNGKLEVGITELMYPVSWQTRPSGCITFYNNRGDQIFSLCITVYPNDTISNIAAAITRACRLETVKVTCSYNEDMREFRLNLLPDHFIHKIVMNESLAELLGFETLEFTELHASEYLFSEVEPEIGGIGSFYIYTDIITHQHIGDVDAKVLRVVSLDQANGIKSNFINKIFDVPHYVDLERNNIDTINITIKDTIGENIKFKHDFGQVLVKLHFRQKFY